MIKLGLKNIGIETVKPKLTDIQLKQLELDLVKLQFAYEQLNSDVASQLKLKAVITEHGMSSALESLFGKELKEAGFNLQDTKGIVAGLTASTEGMMADAWAKVKEYIKKFIEWIKSFFNSSKTDEQLKSIDGKIKDITPEDIKKSSENKVP